MMIKIYKLDKITPTLVTAFEKLMPQLADGLTIPDEVYLKKMVEDKDINLFVAELDGEIVGTLTLIITNMLSGRKGRIEDVIVDEKVRGKGVANRIMQHSIDYAKQEGVEKIDLTSSPSRIAAHKLYEKCGFVKRETSVFRLDLFK